MTLEREASLKYVLQKSYSEKNDAPYENSFSKVLSVVKL